MPPPTTDMSRVALFDAHVHVHATTDVALLLNSASRNFTAAATALSAGEWYGTLMLAEMSGVNWFGSLPVQPDSVASGGWRISKQSQDAVTAEARADDACVKIVAGRQINTAEKIEVLALGSSTNVRDGQSLADSILAAHHADAMVVLPWGAGKWLGPRGKLVERALEESTIPVFAGDNAGRPALWPTPPLFTTLSKAGRPVLSGTDNLPLPREECRAGAFGFWISGGNPDVRSGRELASLILQKPCDVGVFGRPASMPHFLRTQVALRLHRS